jgi:hypothetical protein
MKHPAVRSLIHTGPSFHLDSHLMKSIHGQEPCNRVHPYSQSPHLQRAKVEGDWILAKPVNELLQLPDELMSYIGSFLDSRGLRAWRETCWTVARCDAVGQQLQWQFNLHVNMKQASQWPICHLQWSHPVSVQHLQHFAGYEWPVVRDLVMTPCRRLTDAEWLTIPTRVWHNLHTLSLSCCYQLTDDALCVITDTIFPALQHLDVSFCPELSDIGCQALARHRWLSLQSLRFRCCSLLTDVGVVAFSSQTRPALQHLDLFGCKQLTDVSWVALTSQRLPQLQTLRLGNCTQLTSVGWSVFASQPWTELKSLGLQRCSNLTQDGWDVFKSRAWLSLRTLNGCDFASIIRGGWRVFQSSSRHGYLLPLTNKHGRQLDDGQHNDDSVNDLLYRPGSSDMID